MKISIDCRYIFLWLSSELVFSFVLQIIFFFMISHYVDASLAKSTADWTTISPYPINFCRTNRFTVRSVPSTTRLPCAVAKYFHLFEQLYLLVNVPKFLIRNLFLNSELGPSLQMISFFETFFFFFSISMISSYNYSIRDRTVILSLFLESKKKK